MRAVKNTWGEAIRNDLEFDDIEIGEVYRGNDLISPQYLCQDKLTVVKFGRKNIICTSRAYGDQKFYVQPHMLSFLDS